MDNHPQNSRPADAHWWYDAKTAGVRNSPPTGSGMRSFETRKLSDAQPSLLTGMNTNFEAPMGMTQQRRESLKNMVHLCDFATP